MEKMQEDMANNESRMQKMKQEFDEGYLIFLGTLYRQSKVDLLIKEKFELNDKNKNLENEITELKNNITKQNEEIT